MGLRRLNSLFLRYRDAHADRLCAKSIGLPWRRLGRVERIARRADGVHLAGWVRAGQITVSWSGGSLDVSADILRSDLAGRPDARGFECALPATAHAPYRLTGTRPEGRAFAISLADPEAPLGPIAGVRLRLDFARALLRAAPALWRYWRHRAPDARAEVKRALGLERSAPAALLDPCWLAPALPLNATPPEVILLIPVHGQPALVQKCLDRVARHTDLPWRAVVIDDASPDPETRPLLRGWVQAQKGRARLIMLDENLGFIGAANRGFEAIAGMGGPAPVVLLNTDAMLPDGWARRLLAPLANPMVASVTPMSNAAEIFSVPVMGPGIALVPGEAEAIDAVAREFGPGPLPEAPTGVGFCMALSRRWLKRVGHFDPAFGKGYGEEVDWCQRARLKGGRHLCQPALFVEHIGGQSFGTARKARALAEAGRRITARYPRYDADVQAFIASDPLATPRLALALALADHRAGADAGVPLFLAHSLGGGAEIALQRELAAKGCGIVLRVGGPARWGLEVHVAGHVTTGVTDDLDLVRALLRPLRRMVLIYSCGVGDPYPATLPEALLSLRRPRHGDRVEMRMHDYFPLSPSYTLLGSRGYRGVPKSDDPDPAHQWTGPDGVTLTLAEWRAAWGALVVASDRVQVYSRASREIVARAYPHSRLDLAPHTGDWIPARVPRGGAAIGLLGNLNRQKGAEVLIRLATRMPERRFVVIGNVDPLFDLPGNIVVHGAYAPDEIAGLAKGYGVGIWLFPAIWPETYSFAVREALSTGLPVLGFDLGAQGEALREAASGVVVPLGDLDLSALRMHQALEAAFRPRAKSALPRCPGARDHSDRPAPHLRATLSGRAAAPGDWV